MRCAPVQPSRPRPRPRSSATADRFQRRHAEMSAYYTFITALLLFNGMTATSISSASQTPEDFVLKVLSDRYLRSPIVVLIEGCNKLVYQAEYIWLKIKQIPIGVELTMASYNSSGMGEPVRALDASEIPSVMDFLKTTTYSTRCKSNFAALSAVKEASDRSIPYDSAIILITSHPPNDPDMQLPALHALIKKRCKLHVIWLEKAEVPGKYLEISQPTGGELYEIDDYDWPFKTNQTNELDDDVMYVQTLQTTLQSLYDDDDDDYDDEGRVLQQQVIVAVRRGIKDYLNLPIQVDSSIQDLYITTSGLVYKASIRLPSGGAKELRLQNTTKVPTEMEVGTWLLETVGNNYNVTVHATSRLAYSATVGKRNSTNPSGRNVDLVRLQGEGVLDKVVLVDEMGKELTNLEYIKNSNENSRGMSNNTFGEVANRSYNNYNSEWQLPADKLQNKQYYVQVFGQDNHGSKFTRLSSLKPGTYNMLKPLIVELNEVSQIAAEPGQTINLYYDVINNYYQPVDMMFYAQDNLNFIRGLHPRRQVVMPHTRIQVNLILQLQTSSQHTTDVVTLMAESYFGTITSKSYIYIGYQRTDSGTPDISYTTDGYCRDTLSPSICYSKWWSLSATVQDDSGLLRVRSIPNGLQFKSDFIAGTKDKVYVHYSSTCCDTKVDIIAYDINGNIKTKTIDIERVWLTAGEITAIVLGVILAVLVLILIIVLCIICIRRRRSRNFLMHR